MFGAFHYGHVYFAGAPITVNQTALPPIFLGVPTLAESDPVTGRAESSPSTEVAGSGNFRLD